ncbi:hypothetical protein LINPERHAP1_LOCUS27262 [Linum perenne]
MNDQAQQMMIVGGGGGQPPMMSQPPVMNPLPSGPPLMNTVQSQMMNPSNQAQMLSGHSQAMNQQPMMMAAMNNQRGYKPWMQQNQQSQNQNQHPGKFGYFVPSKPRTNNNNNNNNNWKGNNKDRRMGNNNKLNNNNNAGGLGLVGVGGGLITGSSAGIGVGGGYMPPSLNELQNQNRMKTQKHYHHSKKKYNNRYAPYAPRNSTSFIIRAKKSGGIASLVSPCPVTPAVLPTPDIHIQPMEVLGDVAKEEWGVDGYGSMKGLIRLRSPGHEMEGGNDEDEDDESSGSSESDVEEHVEVERRLDHDLSRFEMIYPSNAGGEYSFNNVLESRVDDQDTHIAHLEEENLTLKERLFLMETELDDLRRRLLLLERHHHGRGGGMEEVNEGIVENMSENDMNENESHGESDGGADGVGDNKMDHVDVNKEHSNEDSGNGNGNHRDDVKLETVDSSMPEFTHDDEVVQKEELKCEDGRDRVATNALDVMSEEVTAVDEALRKEEIVEDKMAGEKGQEQLTATRWAHLDSTSDCGKVLEPKLEESADAISCSSSLKMITMSIDRTCDQNLVSIPSAWKWL